MLKSTHKYDSSLTTSMEFEKELFDWEFIWFVRIQSGVYYGVMVQVNSL